MVDLSELNNLTIIRCTPDQIRVAISNNPPIEQVDRDWMQQQADAQPSDIATWALVPRNDPSTTDLLAHCDTYRRRAMLKVAGDERTSDAVAYGVSAVFCPPQYRRRGYATRFLQLLHYVLAPADILPPFPTTWGSPPAVPPGYGNARFSFLYSGIDGSFYAKCSQGEGASSQPGWGDDTQFDPTAWQWLDADGVAALQGQYDRVIASDVGGDPGVDARYTRFGIVPDLAALSHGAPSTLTGGARFGMCLEGPGPSASSQWFTYFPTIPDPTMSRRIVLSHVQGHVPFAALMTAAVRAGAAVIEYGGSRNDWDAEAGGVTIDTEWPRPCIALYGFGDERVEWVSSHMLIVEGVGVDQRWAWY